MISGIITNLVRLPAVGRLTTEETPSYCLSTQLEARKAPDLDVLARLGDCIGDHLLDRLGAVTDRSLLEQDGLLACNRDVVRRQLVFGHHQRPRQAGNLHS